MHGGYTDNCTQISSSKKTYGCAVSYSSKSWINEKELRLERYPSLSDASSFSDVYVILATNILSGVGAKWRVHGG